MDKIFTPREIDALIPRMEAIFKRIVACQTRVRDLNTTRPVPSATPSVAEMADSARIRSQMEFLLLAVQDDIALIAQLGGVVKDIEAGLVDFLGRVEGEEVWFCWKRGEHRVDFWHALNAGFSLRRSLTRRDDRATTPHKISRRHS